MARDSRGRFTFGRRTRPTRTILRFAQANKVLPTDARAYIVELGTREERKRLIGHRHLSERDKLNTGVPLNIWDAARSYRTAHGEPKSPLREVIKDDEFRHAWDTFRGGYRWRRAGEGENTWMVRGARKNTPGMTSFDDKMAAATVLGWGPPRTEAIERLRNISP